MKRFLLPFLISIMIIGVACQKTNSRVKYIRSSGSTFLNVPVADIESEVKNFLKAWYPTLIDTLNGGYWTNLSEDFSILENREKMLVTQARGLWTASRAAGIFPDNPVFRKAADHGFKFLTTKMWDETNGGFIQIYKTDPPSVDYTSPKTTYANSFALYSLSEYYKINNDPQVLDWIKKSFKWIEEKAREPEYFGYYNIVSSNGQPPRSSRWGKPGIKDQNTSIHLLEAFTNTYRVWPDNLVKLRLEEILKLIRDKMINEKGFLNLFFTKDWRPIVHVDSSRSYILNNIYTDHVSFGHNIETAYLLIDASNALNGKTDDKTLKIAKKLINHTLANGFDKDYYGLFDKGYYFKGSQSIEIVNTNKVWWSQAEAWHTLALAAKYFPQNEIYKTAFYKMWIYLKEQQIDPDNHGWYNNGLDSDPDNEDAPKGHQWKGAYHDGRALIQVYTYATEAHDG